MRYLTAFGLAAVALAVATGSAPAASSPTRLGVFKDWTAWQSSDQYGKICFISAAPATMEPTKIGGKPVVRDPVHLLIIHRDKAPSVDTSGAVAKDKNGNLIFKKVHNEVQAQLGYPLQPTTTTFFHSAAIDGKSFPMRSVANDPSTPINEDQVAWLASSNDEASFVAALKGSTKLVVNGTSIRGTKTFDTYALSGVTPAMASIDKACP